MIRYSNEEGFIKSSGIKFKDKKDKDVVLPKVAVGVFSRYLFDSIVKEFSGKLVGYITTANLEKEVYVLKYRDIEITFFMAGVGAPVLVGDIEDLSHSGVSNFIIFGNCGVLDNKISDCSIIIPTKGFREEGTSYHYVEPSDDIVMNPKYKEDFIEILNENGFDYTCGYTWTTDAFYRETREKIAYFKKLGAVCVEMEGTALAAVCQRLSLDYFTFYYAGDNLDNEEWDKRSLDCLVNFEKKKRLRKLALELAYKMSK